METFTLIFIGVLISAIVIIFTPLLHFVKECFFSSYNSNDFEKDQKILKKIKTEDLEKISIKFNTKITELETKNSTGEIRFGAIEEMIKRLQKDKTAEINKIADAFNNECRFKESLLNSPWERSKFFKK